MDLTTTKKYPGGTLTITKHPAHGTERHQHSIGDARAAAAASRPATAVPEGIESVERSFIYDATTQNYVPTVLVSMRQCHGDDRDAWARRDRLADMLSAAPQPEAKRATETHCQNGRADICRAGQRDGVVCPEGSCDIDDGIREPDKPEAKAGADDWTREAVEVMRNVAAELDATGRHSQRIARLIEAVPKPAEGGAVEMSPEFTDTVRGAIAWVLYHHQGGSSAIGKPLRYALGLGAHEDMPTHLIQQAKHFASAAGRSTADFHAPAAATRAEEVANIDAIDHAVKMLEDVHGDRVTAGSLRRVARRLAGKGE